MTTVPGSQQRSAAADRLTRLERLSAALIGGVLLCLALALLVWPPEHQVALPQCSDASAGCIVSVDSDLSTFGAALAAIGALVALVGILGIRFNRVKLAGNEFSQEYAEETEGYSEVQPVQQAINLPPRLSPLGGENAPEKGPEAPPGSPEPSWPDHDLDELHESAPGRGPEASDGGPIIVEVHEGLGESLRAPAPVPIAITRLTRRIREVEPSFLRDYQAARRESQHGFFLTHILGPATSRRQAYSVAIRVSPHKDEDPWQVKSASFYLGRSWGSQVFEGQRGADGKYGITTQAWGPFLALCEVEFDDGTRILLDHYCDFDMGSLLASRT